MSELAAVPLAKRIKKLHIKETTLFAINNIPGVDATTLEKFLELVNSTGTFGTMSDEEILAKMSQMLKYVPGTCTQSLLILVDLLDIEIPVKALPALLNAPHQISSTSPKVGEMETRPSRRVQG